MYNVLLATLKCSDFMIRSYSKTNHYISKIVFFWDINQHNSSRWTSLFESVNAIHIYNQLLLCDVDEFENKLLSNFENDWV